MPRGRGRARAAGPGRVRDRYAAVPGGVVSIHRLPPGGTPLGQAESDTLHIHLGRATEVRGTRDGLAYAHIARPGQVSVVPRGSWGSEQWHGPVEYLTVALGGPVDVAGSPGDGSAPDLRPVPQASDPLLRELGQAAARQLAGPGPVDVPYLEAVVEMVRQQAQSVASTRRPRAAAPSPDPGATGPPPAGIRDALQRLHDESGSQLTVADLARAAGLSRAHFSREFRRAVGLPPYQYLVRFRVHRARRLLAVTDAPLAEVAVRVGFAHQSHLHRHFVRWVGETPGRFAARHRTDRH